ncbi:thioredoxin [Kordia sp. SMS9]|uniref:thioredoxin family protein n=1 Tax=Kordia sp. SMS9 TaxID=2282170 RepID=UPI000E0D7237|nr:thioredoxin family protein [Kordia sp. SMS9]AXG69352.1 thioredoxin [Kordia sp. SMS9]
MNKLFIFIMTLLVSQILCSQSVNQLTKDSRGRDLLLGKITKEGLTSNSFNSWFSKNYEAYEPDAAIIEKLKRKLKKYNITIFMGTWCGDSKREVPKFFKLLEAADFPKEKLHIIGVNNTHSQYKKSPNGEEKGLNIHRVPTFIVYNKRGKEIGRIVEHPVESFEADLLQICKKKSYKHNYQIVTKLHELFEKKGVEYVTENQEKVISKLKPYSKSLKELNTYGYVFLRAKAFQKAMSVFKLNSKLFPENKNGYDSLAEAYFTIQDYENATKYYTKVLALDANDANAKKMLAKMEK